VIELKLQPHEISKKNHSNNFAKEKIEIFYSITMQNRSSTIIALLTYLNTGKSFENF
jgi:hypothetical protein